MPMRRERYPADWDQISQMVRGEAGWRCEWCGVPNHELGARDRFGVWCSESEMEGMNSTEGFQRWDEYPRLIRIVLTVAHVDRNPANNERSNLVAVCQRCHLNHDRDHHVAEAYRTRRRRKVEGGQVPMPGVPQ